MDTQDMSPDSGNSLYTDLSDHFVVLCKMNGVELSGHSLQLVRLSVEAWFEDSLDFKETQSQESMRNLAERIFAQALQDPHISDEQRRRPKVSFANLLHSLAIAGQNVVHNMIHKGFI